MKKFLITIILSLVVFSSAVPYLLYPQRAQGWGVVFDPSVFSKTVEGIAAQARGYAQQIKDFVVQNEQLIELIQTVKTAKEIYSVGKTTYDFIAQENYGAITKGILGYAGLGSLSPVMTKFMNGVGLDKILVDEVGGALGLGGILQGGLQGIFTQEDTISSLLGQIGLKIPSSTLGKLKDLGIFSPEGIMRAITCGGKSGSGAAKPPPSGGNLPAGGGGAPVVERGTQAGGGASGFESSYGGATRIDGGAQPAPAQIPWCFTYTQSGAPKSTCANNQVSCESVRQDYITLRPDSNPTSCSANSTGFSAAYLAPVVEKSTQAGGGASGFESSYGGATRIDGGAPVVEAGVPAGGGGGCGAKGGVIGDKKEIEMIRRTLDKFGLTGMDDNMITKLVEQGIIDKETALKNSVADTPIPTTSPVLPSPPCVDWGPTGETGEAVGGCLKIRTSFSDHTDNKKDVPTDPAAFIIRFFTYILGAAGGIALLLIISAGYKLITSSGKPEGIQQGREQLTAAIVGLIFIIFSFVIFQLIVVDILKIPGICKDPNDPSCAASQEQLSKPRARFCQVGGVTVPCPGAGTPYQNQWCFTYKVGGGGAQQKCEGTQVACNTEHDQIIAAGTDLQPSSCTSSPLQGAGAPATQNNKTPNWVAKPQPGGGTCWDDTNTGVTECNAAPPAPQNNQAPNWVAKPQPGGGTCWDDTNTGVTECNAAPPAP